MVERLDRSLTTVEGLERHEGHLLNWYDTSNLAPLMPRYVSTVDSGNLAGALIALAEGCRRLAGQTEPSRADLAARLADVAGRAVALAEGMDFAFLYDQRRQLFSIGYRLADAGGPGRADASYYDLLASEARLGGKDIKDARESHNSISLGIRFRFLDHRLCADGAVNALRPTFRSRWRIS